VKQLRQFAWKIALSPLLIGALAGTGIPLAHYVYVGSDSTRGGSLARQACEHLAHDIVVWCCAGFLIGLGVDLVMQKANVQRDHRKNLDR
jgi:hypothetical protein